MIVHGRVRPDVDPELAGLDPMAASEWFSGSAMCPVSGSRRLCSGLPCGPEVPRS